MAEENSKIKKAKSFKRIRGFLRGESRRQRKAKKEAENKRKSSANAAAPRADDESTIYGVDVDDRSVATRQSDMPGKSKEALSSKKKTLMLKVVLLLMDVKTRRFELLQLEFDSKKALVSDVLAQIPVSVTEEVLRKQSYTGICGSDGDPMPPSKLLSTFCKGNEVLVAVPNGVEATECARLAKPILGDDKVVSMLAASGIDANVWKMQQKKKAEPEAPIAAKSAPAVAPKSAPVPPPSPTKDTSSGGTPWYLVAVIIAVILQVFHVYISAPVKPGHTLSPGLWLSKCGVLAFMPSCENAYFKLDADGKATVYNDDRELVWEMQGAVCSDDSCTPGLVLRDDGTIVIGGKKMYVATLRKKGASLSPWPFAEEPKIKVSKKY